MRPEKQLLLDDIKGQVERYPSFLIISYIGLKANAVSAFRTCVAKMGGSVEMVPKRIFRRGAKELGIELDSIAMEGHVGLVFTAVDPVEVTKYVYDFQNESERAVNVVGGHVDGQLYDAKQVELLSKLPGLQQLRSQFVSLLQAPSQKTVATMQALVTSVLYCLENKSKLEGN